MPRKRPFLLGLSAVLWVAGVAAAFGALTRYAARPGPALPPGEGCISSLDRWRTPGRPLLVMAVHPRCPCTAASLDEMGDLLARAHGACDALLIRYQAPGWPAGAPSAELSGIRVPVVSDPDGRLAGRLGARTSGHCILIDAGGRVRFYGGLTVARGHRGRSPAQDAILAVLAGGSGGLSSAPVYGCSLSGGCRAPAP